MKEFKKEINDHNQLNQETVEKLGKIHYALLSADHILDKDTHFYKENENRFDDSLVITKLGEEIGGDEIHWWIYKREVDVIDMLNKSKNALENAQQIKIYSRSLILKNELREYEDIISIINIFLDKNKDNISILYNYVNWLKTKSDITPIMLFSVDIWGSTTISDRYIQQKDMSTYTNIFNLCGEIVLGLWSRGRYRIDSEYHRMYFDRLENIDPEDQTQIFIPKNELLIRTSRMVFREIETYFTKIRDSLRRIVREAESYLSEKELINRDSFWSKVIEYTMEDEKVEADLWDFKETLEMFHVSKPTIKLEKEIKLCEIIASFANNKGGIIIIGISDNMPRDIIGIEDVEDKMKYISSTIKKHIEYENEFTYIKEVQITVDDSIKKCIVIAISQTKDPVSIKKPDNSYTYPYRDTSGMIKESSKKIEYIKENIYKDNYHFLSEIYKNIA